MAEVGQRLGSGAYRLSALKVSQGRPVCAGGSPGCLLINCASSHSGVKEEAVRDQRAAQPASKSKAARRRSEKLPKDRKSQQDSGTLVCGTSSGPASPHFIRFVDTRESLQAHISALNLAAGLLQEKLLPCRMTPWTRGPVSIHPDTFRSPQQLRAFCTVVFFLAEQRSERLGCGRRLRRLKLHPDTLRASTTTRSYSWSSEHAPPQHRSRTVYYDILKVSPSATQAQIKTAYYKQSFIYHPDKNPGSKEAIQRFSEISEAYNVLGNISLRRKYDRGILSQSDIQSAGRPSSKETASRSTGPTQQQQHQQRARQFSQPDGRPMFDFDAFYQAHYGEQLQRERDMRARKQRMKEEQQQKLNKWHQQRAVELAMTMVMAMAGLIFLGLSRP